MTATLIVMCALSGAGKTSYVNNVLQIRYPQALILASDDVRWTMMGGQTVKYKGGSERFVREAIEAYARGRLSYGCDVIVDSTNLIRAARQEKIAWAREWGATAQCIYLKVSREEAERRCFKMQGGDKIFGPTAIAEMAAALEEPTIEEGWDSLDVIDVERQTKKGQW